MKVFHELVYDDYVDDVNPTYSDPAFNALLGAAERLGICVVADEVSGSAPAVNVAIEHSGDERNWVGKRTVAAVNATGVSAGLASSQTVSSGDFGGVPGLGYTRLTLSMASGSAARMRVWVTGRTEAEVNGVEDDELGDVG